MTESIVRSVQCAYCLRHSVNVTYQAGLDADAHRVEQEVDAGEVLDRRMHRAASEVTL